LNECGDDLQLLPGRFPKLSELHWRETFIPEMMYVLGQVGQQLRTLCIDGGGTLHLDRLLESCPNLSELDIITNAVCKLKAVQICDRTL
jgi:Leucine-rich repeat (LRR) protein